MEIKIEIPDDQVQEIITNSFKNIDQEVLQNIVIESFRNRMMNDTEWFEKLFFARPTYYSNPQPTDLCNSILRKIDISSVVNPIQEAVLTGLTGENMHKVMTSIISDFILGGLCNSMYNSEDFRYRMRCIIGEMNNHG